MRRSQVCNGHIRIYLTLPSFDGLHSDLHVLMNYRRFVEMLEGNWLRLKTPMKETFWELICFQVTDQVWYIHNVSITSNNVITNKKHYNMYDFSFPYACHIIARNVWNRKDCSFSIHRVPILYIHVCLYSYMYVHCTAQGIIFDTA